MAITAAGAQLTRAERAEQLALRAGSLQKLVALWRTVDPTDLSHTIDTFVDAAVIIASSGFDRSGAIAARYYSLFRRVEGVSGLAPALALAARPPEAKLAGELRGAALSGIIVARRRGFGPAEAKHRGFIKVVGALSKLVMTGGRMTIIGMTGRDRQALGWSRVTTDTACAFCRMLASRGPAYKAQAAAEFEAHDTCACTAEPSFRGDGPLAQAEEYARQWNEAQSVARRDGTSSTGTANNALNNFRRYLAGGATASVSPVTEESG